MPTHTDAIGYIRDLGRSEGISWLEMICDLSGSGETTLSPINLKILVQLFTKRASYVRQTTSPQSAAPIGTAPAAVEGLRALNLKSSVDRFVQELSW